MRTNHLRTVDRISISTRLAIAVKFTFILRKKLLMARSKYLKLCLPGVSTFNNQFCLYYNQNDRGLPHIYWNTSHFLYFKNI